MDLLIRMREGEDQAALKPNIDGNTALHLAVLEGHYNCVKKLVEAYPSLIMKLNGDSMSPLECATANGKLRIVKVLLHAGADPYNEISGTPNAFMYAAYYGQATILDYLLKNVEETGTCIQVIKQVSPRIPYGYTDLRIAIERKNDNCVLAMLQHDATWLKSIKHSWIDPETGMTDSIFRLLVRKMPEMALLVMDKSIINLHGSHPDSKELELRFNFSYLDDTFEQYMQKTKQELINSSDQKRKLLREVRAYEKIHGDINKASPQYTNNVQELLDNHPLTRMAETEDEDLLSHPLTNALIQQKWKKFGFKYYVPNFLLYFVFVTLLTSFILSHKPSFRLLYDHQNLTYYSFEEGCERLVVSNQDAYYGLHRLIHKILLLIVCSLCSAKEFWQFFNSGFRYLADCDNYVELSIYGLTYFIVWDFGHCAN
ncbi:hypothetical protein Ciccas_009957, partial [Cichlidogyrus casuarinus]